MFFFLKLHFVTWSSKTIIACMSSVFCVCCPKIGFIFSAPCFFAAPCCWHKRSNLFFSFLSTNRFSNVPHGNLLLWFQRPGMVVEERISWHTHTHTESKECVVAWLAHPNELFTLLFASLALIFQCPSCHSSSLISSLTSFIRSPPSSYLFFLICSYQSPAMSGLVFVCVCEDISPCFLFIVVVVVLWGYEGGNPSRPLCLVFVLCSFCLSRSLFFFSLVVVLIDLFCL